MIEYNIQESISEYKKYQDVRISHWDKVAEINNFFNFSSYYHKRLQKVFQFIIPSGQRVLEIGCGKGDLLASLHPSYGLGIDFSSKMINQAKKNYPGMHFIQADAHELNLNTEFDYVILSDLLNDLWDVQTVLQKIASFTSLRSRIVINSYSRMWELPLFIVRKLGLGKPNLYQNWLTLEDISGLLSLSNFEIVRHWDEIIWPIHTPVIDRLFNKYIVKIWPFNWLAISHIIIAKPMPSDFYKKDTLKVSVIIPARNESGNISQIFERTPEMGAGTEIIFIEGNSIDDTFESIQKAIKDNPQKSAKLFRQEGMGKGDAVRLGFKKASGDILMILDADLSVAPENLPLFYEVIAKGKAEFINGVRLVYPMEREAMRFLNFLGNKFFSLAFSWLLGQPVKDTLCGTKVLWKKDYERIAANRHYFGNFDPFGDFDLLFGAAKLNLKIVGLPIRYRERTYGKTNISRWKHGWLLLKMVFFALKRIKFV